MNNVNPPTSETIIQSNLESNYDFGSVKRIPLYFGTEDKPLLGWLHTTDSKQHSNTGVIICPPLAVEYMNSYRSMRYVADYFALAGIPALRFDYHGTGSSSGLEEDEDRLKNWLWSINQAIEQLKTITNCKKFGLFGFRMGATLASLITENTPVEFLILWAALNNGKKYIREIKLIQMTSDVQIDDNSLLEAGGMGYWEQTVNDISKINLKNIAPKSKCILIIPRDEQKNDTELFHCWEMKNLKVEQQYHIGSTLMLVDAHLTVVPHEAIKNIVKWTLGNIDKQVITNIVDSNIGRFKTWANISCYNDNKHIQKNTTIKESVFYFGEKNKLFAIISENNKQNQFSLPTIIITNSGANHNAGPSRLYTLISRRLSQLGFRCIRIDVSGIGDSIIKNPELENVEYIDSSNTEISDAIKAISPQVNNDNFILMGLCSGAYFSFHAALELKDIKINECILINPLTFYWDEGMSIENSPIKNFSIWNWYKEAVTTRNSWIKLFKGKIDFKSLLMAIKNRIVVKFTSKFTHLKNNTTIKAIDRHQEELALDLKTISNNNTHIQFILSRSDPGYDILMTNAGRMVKSLKKNGQLGIDFIDDADHTFSKYRPRCAVINLLTNHFKNRYCKN